MIELVVGLGNPGQEYERTRHNIAWMVLGRMPQLDWQKKFKGEYAALSDGKKKIYFLKPLTFMNLSGESILALVQFFKIDSPAKILVIHDELDLPFGTVVLKKGGGLAGHNGLKSIAATLGTQDFCRLRMGISRPQHGSVSDYVLSRFSGQEANELDNFLDLGHKVVLEAITNGFESAASLFSKKSI